MQVKWTRAAHLWNVLIVRQKQMLKTPGESHELECVVDESFTQGHAEHTDFIFKQQLFSSLIVMDTSSCHNLTLDFWFIHPNCQMPWYSTCNTVNSIFMTLWFHNSFHVFCIALRVRCCIFAITGKWTYVNLCLWVSRGYVRPEVQWSESQPIWSRELRQPLSAPPFPPSPLPNLRLMMVLAVLKTFLPSL